MKKKSFAEIFFAKPKLELKIILTFTLRAPTKKEHGKLQEMYRGDRLQGQLEERQELSKQSGTSGIYRHMLAQKIGVSTKQSESRLVRQNIAKADEKPLVQPLVQ